MSEHRLERLARSELQALTKELGEVFVEVGKFGLTTHEITDEKIKRAHCLLAALISTHEQFQKGSYLRVIEIVARELP